MVNVQWFIDTFVCYDLYDCLKLQNKHSEKLHSYGLAVHALLLLLLLLLLLFKNVGSARLRQSDIHPISAKTAGPQYQPIDWKKRKGKLVEDYSTDRAA